MADKVKLSRVRSVAAQARRLRSFSKLARKKDLRVSRSSRGKFTTVAALEAHRLKVTGKKLPRTSTNRPSRVAAPLHTLQETIVNGLRTYTLVPA